MPAMSAGRRPLMAHVGAVVFLAALSALTLPRPQAVTAPATLPPNIILILTDDLDAKSIAVMPQLRALLADQGTAFENFFVTYALCCPSRASILRGQYPHNHQILTNTPPNGGFERFRALGHEQSTVATWLKAAGYRTVLLGKYLNGYPDRNAPTHVPPGWDEWYSPVGGQAYGNYNYRMNENGRLVEYGNRPEDYLTDVLARKAADAIRRAVEEGKPVFVHLGTYAPHAPATPAPRHQHAFADATAPRPPSFNEADVTDKPGWLKDRRPLSADQIARIDEHYRTRLRSLLAVDDLIASLVSVLRETGQLDRTFIFFTSDNGFHLGEHRLPAGKNTAYEEDIRVPMIVRGPGVPARQTLEHLALNNDLAPTFAALAGAAVPGFVDGRSLVPLLGATPPLPSQWRQAFLVEHYQARAARPGVAPGATAPNPQQVRVPGVPEYQAVRTAEALYVEYASGEKELYDLKSDPYQLRNTAATAPGDLLARLGARLAELRRCTATGCRAVEDAR